MDNELVFFVDLQTPNDFLTNSIKKQERNIFNWKNFSTVEFLACENR